MSEQLRAAVIEFLRVYDQDPVYAGDLGPAERALRAAARAAPSAPEQLRALRESIEVHGDLHDEGGTVVEPSPEYDEWLRRVAVAYGRLVVLALRAVDVADALAAAVDSGQHEQYSDNPTAAGTGGSHEP